jgi:hypothetical protein
MSAERYPAGQLGHPPQQHRVADRVRRCDQEQTLRLGRKPLDPAPEDEEAVAH